jgi:type IV pilus assembly protein PilE
MLSLRAGVAKRGNLRTNIKTNNQIAIPDKNFWGLTPATIHFNYFNLDSRFLGNDKMCFNKAFARAKTYFMYGGSIMNTINKKAFTLIEMLVVVLIIGILAAIALPQYEKAVEKSRAAEALSVMKTIKQAQEVYLLITDNYTTDFAELDVTLPGNPSGDIYNTKYFSYVLVKESNYIYLDIYRRNSSYSYWFTSMFDKSKYGVYQKGGEFYCSARSEKDDELCKALGGVYLGREQNITNRYKI